MSIAITLGVTTPETTYNEMAAGLEPESIEASPAVNEKSYSSHSRGNTPNYGPRGLPYAMQQSSVVCCQDHNYGAPPPPTPPASPLSQSVFTHANRNGVLGSQNCFPSNEVGHSADSESSLEGSDMVVEGTVRPSWCQCCLMQDGFLLKCEGCRGLEKKGLDVQRRKNENISVGESSGTESGDEDMSPSAVSYTATQHTPTSITLTVKRVKRSKVKKRKKSTEKTRTTTKAKKLKDYREGSRKSMRMKNSVSEASIVDENTTDGWDTQIRQWTNQYEEALANQYSADVQMLLEHYRAKCNFSPSFSPVAMDTINRTELACNNIVLSSQMQLQLGRVTRVQKNNKILRAARDLDTETLIIEYRGKVMLRQQFEVNGHFFKKPYPFVLFYSNFNEVEMCVDARTFGNEARFVRRSCTPNAVVRHKIVEGMIHLCIYAVSPISKDSEVTIGFDYEFNSCNYKVDCACHKGSQDCPVQRHNLSPFNPLSSTHSSPLPGAETRKRQTRRKEKEADKPVPSLCNASKPNDTIEPQGISNTKDCSVLESVKLKNGEELDENGADATVDLEKPASAPIPASKSQQCRTSKPRPKSRLSRYRSSSTQRARRQRQALFQQNVAEGVVGSEEGSQGAGVKEHNQGGAASPHLQDGEQYGVFAGMANKANARYPKTKKYLVTEWLSDKVSEPLEESPLRITTDPTVLATTLNMLPGLSHLSLICTTPKHYVRFGSPFNPERRRRPFVLDSAYGSCKKRWMKQALDESMLSGLLEDGTASNSSQKSDTSSSLPFRPELTGPFKKRKHSSEMTSAPSDLLFQPLSPISPPLPSDLQTPRPLSTPSSLYLGREMENATLLSYSPLTSLPPSRCNTPLQFENISSPETSPVHRSESLTPEPCFHVDSGPRVSAFPGLSSWSSPASVCDEFLLDGYGCGLTRSSAPPPPTLCDSSSAEPQNLRTEFNLIYTCSPLNASLPAAPANDKHFPQSEGVQTSTDSTSQGLSTETGSGSLSLYLDSQMGSGYSEIGTSPLQINPPQKKKVSLLEYRNRKRGPQDPDSLHPPAYHSQPSASLHNSSPEHLSPPRLHTQTTVLSRPESNHRTLSTSAGQFREGLGSNANVSVNCAFTRTNVGMNDQTSSCVKDMVKIETPPSASCPPKLLPASSSTRPAESVTQCLLHMDSTAHHHSQRADSTSRHFSAPALQHYSQRNLQGAAIWTPSGTY